MKDGKQEDQESGRNVRRIWLFALIPATLFLLAVVIVPLVDTLVTSVTDPEPGLANYREFFTNAAFVRILVRTLVTAAVVTLACLLIGYPYAYLMTLVGGKMRIVMIGAVLLPFWTSAVVRTFAWMVILQPTGVVNRLFGVVGLGPFDMIGNLTGVMLAMIQVMLPLMILPLFANFSSINRRLMVAATGLGSPPFRAFRRVFLPLSLPGIAAGCVIVFVSSIGFYLIPQILGSPRQQLLSQLIVDQISMQLNFGLGSAMAFVLFVATMFFLVLSRGLTKGGQEYGATSVLPTEGSPTLSGRRPYGLACFAVLVAIILVGPALILVPLSFTAQASFVFPPESWSTRWYVNFFADEEWTAALLSSVRIAVIVMILATTMGTLAAFAIVRSRSRLAGAAQALIIAPRVVPTVIVAVAVYPVFLVWGLTSTVTGFVLVHTALAIPFVVISVAAGLQTFDERLETAAANLGSNQWRRFRRISLPLLMPSIASGAVFAFITSFDEVIVSLFLQGPFLRTLPVKMFSSIQDRIDPTIAAASTLILCLATMLILGSLVFRKGKTHVG